MGKISLNNASNNILDVDVIRYFENNNNEYLIYSLNETVGDDYIKLYASKIIGNGAHIITDDEEWALVKEIVKNIIKSNHEGTELKVVDLDENELSDIVLQDTRIFKLQGNLVNLLSDNKHVVKKEIDIPLEDLDELEETEDYKELYEIELNKNKELKGQISELTEKVSAYQDKFDKIIDLIEE